MLTHLRLTLLLVGSLLALGVETPVAEATFPGANGVIAYVQSDASDAEIAVINPDGTDARLLTDDAVYERTPSFSPDGRRIAYTTLSALDRQRSEIWVMNADGSGARQVARTRGDAEPSFSPNGRKLIFSTGTKIETIGIASGKTTTLIKAKPTFPDVMSGPEYSPDGRLIVFSGTPAGERGKRAAIWTARSDGSHPRRLTHPPFADLSDISPDFSPDGRSIAFARLIERDNGQVFVMDRSGSNQRPISDNPYQSPAFSPDGSELAMNSPFTKFDGCVDLFVAAVAGGQPSAITNNCQYQPPAPMASAPSWQPIR